jgi:hypothetical protein
MPVKRSGSVAALPPAAGRRARARLCLRLAAPLSFLLLLAVLLRTQPLLGVPPDAPPPAAGPAKVAFLFLVRAAVPLDFLWDAFFRVSTGGSLFSLSDRSVLAHLLRCAFVYLPSRLVDWWPDRRRVLVVAER